MAGAAHLIPARPPSPTPALLALLALLLSAAGCDGLSARPTINVWIVDDGEQVLADGTPTVDRERFESAARRVTLSAAINETVALQLVLRGRAGAVDIELTDLRGPGRTLRAAEVVDLFRVHNVRVVDFPGWYPGYADRPTVPTDFPDILVPWSAPRGGGPVPLDPDRNSLVWIDLHVPPMTPPGEYTGRLRVSSPTRDEPLYDAEVRLTVLPLALPAARSLTIIARTDPRDLLRTHLGWNATRGEEIVILPDDPAHAAARELVDHTMKLLQAHRLDPVLWAAFPRYRPTGPQTVEIDWQPYDRFVGPYIDGTAYADRVAPRYWPLPVSLDHPDATRNGGPLAPQYARLLGTYLAACQAHFDAQPWAARPLARIVPPRAYDKRHIDIIRTCGAVLDHRDVTARLVAHLPARSLAGLGWYGAPPVDLAGAVDAWAPPASWFEPAIMEREQALGRSAWFMPDAPPYSGALAVAAPPTHALALGWQAYRYHVDTLWIEHAADRGGAAAPLLYSGHPYGLADQPVASIRLKRLRRTALDYELLRMLERSGKRLLAERLASQLVRYAFTDACRDHLLGTLPAGWPGEPADFSLARRLLRQELVNTFAPSEEGASRQLSNLARWQMLLNQAAGVRVDVAGARLEADPAGLRCSTFLTIVNTTPRDLRATANLPGAPVGWQLVPLPAFTVPANSRRQTTLELILASLAYNAEGAYPFDIEIDTPQAGAFRVRQRLAVAAAPRVEQPPAIDGRLDDWPLGVNNNAAAFQLVRGRRGDRGAPGEWRPTQPTEAAFCMDDETLYVAIRCLLQPGEQPSARADNRITVDGAIPWGQDLVEVILCPQNLTVGTASDLHLLQIKPNGVLLGWDGCPTDPPLGPVQPWLSGARVAVEHTPDAWTVEVAIPFDTLGPAARRERVWGLNITRLDARRGEYSSWSGARGYCYSPQALGNLILQRP